MSDETEILRKSPLPRIGKLHERHVGLYEPLCRAYADAACICLSRHHISPADLTIENRTEICMREITWEIPNEQIRRSWANVDDATRDGAYCLSLAIIEAEFGFVTLARAETKTGADYYVGCPEALDLEKAFRLEVSGTDKGDRPIIQSRVKEKLNQLKRGTSNRPGIAAVVGFLKKYAIIEILSDENA
jgi:hypothetical protein